MCRLRQPPLPDRGQPLDLARNHPRASLPASAEPKRSNQPTPFDQVELGRSRSWKRDLGVLSAPRELTTTPCHFPPGTSKWNDRSGTIEVERSNTGRSPISRRTGVADYRLNSGPSGFERRDHHKGRFHGYEERASGGSSRASMSQPPNSNQCLSTVTRLTSSRSSPHKANRHRNG